MTPTPPLTDLQKKALEIAQKYDSLSMQDKIGIIAQAFGSSEGKIETSPCFGKWRGTSDISIRFDTGSSLFIGNRRTPAAKTKRVQQELVNAALVQYNPEIIRATKEAAIAALMEREAKDNAIAEQKGLKPYTLLNVEFNDGTDRKSSGYMGWYHVTLAVDGKICSHMETGLNHDITDGEVSAELSRKNYFPAGALKETDVDYVFNNVGFSSTSVLYSLHISDAVRDRAEKKLAERRLHQDAFAIYHLKDDEATTRLLYRSYDNLSAAGLSVEPANYNLVHTAPLFSHERQIDALEYIYNRFSLYVSDIVALRQNGVVSYHYCDLFWFRPLPDFHPENYLRNAEMTVEDDYGMLDGIINNGPKQSVLEQLHETQEKLSHRENAPTKSKKHELEVV